jgi:hypothetical protein
VALGGTAEAVPFPVVLNATDENIPTQIDESFLAMLRFPSYGVTVIFVPEYDTTLSASSLAATPSP